MAGQYDRKRFIARLLLLSAAQIDGNQGSTNTSCACHAANMTFEQSNRQKQRNKHTPYVVDSGPDSQCRASNSCCYYCPKANPIAWMELGVLPMILHQDRSGTVSKDELCALMREYANKTKASKSSNS